MELAKQRLEGKSYRAEQTLKYKLIWNVLGMEKKTNVPDAYSGQRSMQKKMRSEITQCLVNLDKEFGFHSKCDEKALALALKRRVIYYDFPFGNWTVEEQSQEQEEQ